MRDGIVFGCTQGQPLVGEICRHLDIKPGKRLLERFRNGEIRIQLEENVRDKEVFIVGPVNPPAENALEMRLLARTAKMSSARRVTIVPTIMSYDRQERRTRPREPISAKLFAEDLIRSGADRALLFDVHTESIIGFFEPDMIVDHLYGSIAMIPYLQSILTRPFNVGSPDVGGVARARKYAKYLGVKTKHLVIFSKDRPDAGEIDEESIEMIGSVKGRDLLLVDDIIDSGSTIIEDARRAKAEGARDIYACATHGLFTKGLGAFPRGLFKEIIVTNSVNHGPGGLKHPNVKVTACSIAPLLARAIRRIHDGRSISELFIG